MRIILGIDPGLNHTGWGIIRSHHSKLEWVASGTLNTNSKASLSERLLDLHQQLAEVLSQYTIDEAAIEETFVNKNALSSLKLGHARGVLMCSIMQYAIPLHEYASTKIKKSVVGVGRADKEQIMQMVKLLLPKAVIDSYDAADALAVAITHSHYCEHKELIS